MSNQIDQSFVKQYSANVFHLSQQKGSRLQGTVRQESQRGESAFYDRIGSVSAIEKAGRHMNTPQLDTPHSRRRVTLVDYVYADLIDSADKIRSLNDPTNDYVQAAVWSLGRRKDDCIIDAASGNAFSGKEGSTSVAMPNAQKLHAINAAGTALSNLNVQALRRAKKKLDAADVDESLRRYCVIKAAQLESLLAETETTSSDFNTVKALVQGEINEFLGFTFIRTERLDAQSGSLSFDYADGEVGTDEDGDGSTKCLCYASDGLLLATGMDVMARVSERDDKNYSTQVYAEMGIGCTRMEEAKVVEIFAKDS